MQILVEFMNAVVALCFDFIQLPLDVLPVAFKLLIQNFVYQFYGIVQVNVRKLSVLIPQLINQSGGILQLIVIFIQFLI